MILNIHRFEADITQTYELAMKVTSDVKDIDKSKKAIAEYRDVAQEIKRDFSDFKLNINTKSIANTISRLETIKNLVSTIANTTSKQGRMTMLKSMTELDGTGFTKMLPGNVQSTLGAASSAAAIANDPKQYEGTMNALDNLSTFFKQLQFEIDKTESMIDTNAESFNDYGTSTQRASTSLSQLTGESRTLLATSSANTGAVQSNVAALQEKAQMTHSVSSATNNNTNATNNNTNANKRNTDELKKQPSLLAKVEKGFRSLSLVRLTYLANAVRRVTSGMVGMIENAANYEESLNLYKMALGQYVDEASEWSAKISEKLMLDETDIMQYTGTFYNLSRGLGVLSDDAFTMSKTLTQLTYDMSSYLNISADAANTKLQSAMSGQARAIQGVGVAIQVASLQELAYSLGIKKTVSEMTQAEKTYLRYIQIMRSTEHMQGDLARTIITPANAIRILKTQINLLGRAIGQVLTPIIMEAIPWIMALTQVLTSMAQKLAAFLGYKIQDIDYSTAFIDGADAVGDYADEIGKASKKVKRSLAPFDELNVVTSTSGGGTGDLDSTMLDELSKHVSTYDMLAGYNDEFKRKAKDLEGVVKVLIGTLGTMFAIKGAANFATSMFNIGKSIGSLYDSVKKLTGGNVLSGLLVKLGTLFGITKNVSGATKAGSVIAGWSSMFTGATVAGTGATTGAASATGAAVAGKTVSSIAATTGTSVAGSLAPVAAVVAAVVVALVSLVAGFKKAYDTSYEFRKSLKDMADAFNDVKSQFKQSDFMQGTITAIKDTVAVAKISLSFIWDTLLTVAKWIEHTFIDVLKGAAKTISALMKGDFKGAFESLKGILKDTGRNLVTFGGEMVDNFGNALKKLGQHFGLVAKDADMTVVEQKFGSSLQKMQDSIAKVKLGVIVDEKVVGEIASSLEAITNTISTEMTKAKEKQIESINDMVKRGLLTDKESKDAIKKTKEYYDQVTDKTKAAQKEINDIVNKAKKENRQLTEEENARILQLEESMYDGIARTASDSAIEQMAIKTKLKQDAGNISKEQASIIIKEALTTRDKAIKAAEDQYTKTLQEAEKLKATGAINEETYQKIISDAKIAKDSAIKDARDQYDGVYDEFASCNEDIAKYIDEDTGEVKSKWSVFWDDIGREVGDWWDDHMAKYFTKEYWVTKFENAKAGIRQGMKNVKDTVTTKWEEIKTGFTSGTYFDSLKTSIANAFITAFNKLIDGLNKVINKPINTLNTLMNKLRTWEIFGKQPFLDMWKENPIPTFEIKKMDLQKYEDGGYPTSGELFFANENGRAEFITSIGNRTAVANQDQMVQALTNAIMAGFSMTNTGNSSKQPININIGNERIYSGMVDYQNRESDRYGTTTTITI